MNQLVFAIVTMLAGVLACAFYFFATNWILDAIFPSKGLSGAKASQNLRTTNAIRPWLFMLPALLALAIYLVYPVFESVRLSFHDRSGENLVGLSNFFWMLSDGEFRQSIFNNFLWLLVVPALSTFFGLVIAALTDRIWWGNIAKTLIFMPMAISFVGAAVIWKFVYDYRAEGSEQIGILNAIVTYFGGSPEAWITLPFWNNFFLMVILIWIQTGFAMVILSAALRGIPEETLEAAVIDGANGLQIFFKIMIPQIWGTIAVVWTTITILVLKVFDIVLAMTNGQWQTQVLANLMFDWMFRGGGDFGRGAAIAVVIMVLVVPIMIWNIRNAMRETGGH
ncbi:maltose ABC transporter membrane protein /trehalose ABC transporter membrane protein /sucrose ABC transporter membrane protein [Rhizobium subbaraonis]|uniref:Maltose ABC transporter membrane protein /trehalose ABC transporter membrane protein /sucrose ABC transporter membrane protein n=1 Tax=Rhizobium subbaraonis TaxID=908946 RepID=A0A285UUD7_9HYPH|nr:sugar ABC transporter permease [Rhizobium subbaraonis]SOC45413.1 maltose ABC transporter membrane protein /trehalose ABC transporter membrane protein /sucrose ABC transporter membrane protein [Rhizobium subbaraonis]